MKARDALNAAAARLERVSASPRLDAELLLAHALGIEREALLLSGLDGDVPPAFETLLVRREADEPIAYILGHRGFWTIDLAVAPGVLVPRPDTETLLETALGHFGKAGPRTVLDLGTGSGALLLAALDQWPEATGVGVDRSEVALAIARANGERLGLADRATFRLGDWTDGITGCFDLILCNPPYIEADAELPRDVAAWEPHEALFAGADGLNDYRALAPRIGPVLAEGGIACVEIGVGQEGPVAALFAACRLAVALHPDLSGRVRCLSLTR